jgi:hypothetical protein
LDTKQILEVLVIAEVQNQPPHELYDSRNLKRSRRDIMEFLEIRRTFITDTVFAEPSR